MSETPRSTAAPWFSPDFLQNPYPTYDELLAGRALQHVTAVPGVHGVFGYEHCVWLLRYATLSASKRVRSLIRMNPERLPDWPDWQDLSEHLSSWLLMNWVSTSSAGGQLEHPSDVNSSAMTTTGAPASLPSSR